MLRMMCVFIVSHLKSESQSDDDIATIDYIRNVVKSGVGPPTPSQNNFSDVNPN